LKVLIFPKKKKNITNFSEKNIPFKLLAKATQPQCVHNLSA